MATPFVRESKRHWPLGIHDLVKILDLLERHGYFGVRYYELGIYLGLHPRTLDIIKLNYREDFDRCLLECLEAWLRREDSVMSRGDPTYHTLIKALRRMGENAIADGIEREISISMAQDNDSGSSIYYSIPPTDESEDTSAADRIQEKLEKWLKEGKVELKVTRINMHGAPGAGKTCSQHLLLNEPPPEKLTNSTPIACPAVQATRISIDDENKKWERVEREDLLNRLASHLEEARNETRHKNFKCAHILCLIIIFCYTFVKNSRIGTFIFKFVSKLAQKPKNESTETKPAETESIKKISNALENGKSKKFSTNWVYFIDSGGQPAYRELLPLFTRAAALNIITIDLTKGLDEKCKFQYRINHDMVPIKTKLKYSNRDIIQSTISSGAMLNSIEIPYVTDMPTHPHYLIFGTRKELVDEEKLEEMNESLKEYNTNLKVIPYKKRQGSIIFPVNTLLPAGSKEREEASVNLCTAISRCGVTMTINLPIRLFTFEIELQIEAEKRKRSFLTKEEVIEIGKSLQLDTKSDINDALRYLHNVTIILYYHDVLPNLVFVDPKPILDLLSHLIALTYVDDADLIANPPPPSGEINILMELGLFNESLLKVIGKHIFNKDFKLSHMITLLKHLHIIAEVENREEGSYFFPCALPSCKKFKRPPKKIQPLLIGWEIKNRGTTTLAIPQGLFPLTIVHLLKRKTDEVDFSPPELKPYRYHDAMSLRVYKRYHIDIINRYTHLEIHVRGHCRNICPQIRELVLKAVKESSKDLKLKEDSKLVFAFKCPLKKTCIVEEDKSSTWCTNCKVSCDVLRSDGSYGCWFSDCQSSDPDDNRLDEILDLLKKYKYSGAENDTGYYRLGLKLGLHSTTNDVIEKDHRDTNRRLIECLKKWLQQADNVSTYDTLIKALREIGENAVADGIERETKNKMASLDVTH